MAGASPAGGGPLAPPAALVAPAVAHGFTRCNIPGADNTLDYLRTPKTAKLVLAFPNLGWLDAAIVAPGSVAADEANEAKEANEANEANEAKEAKRSRGGGEGGKGGWDKKGVG